MQTVYKLIFLFLLFVLGCENKKSETVLTNEFEKQKDEKETFFNILKDTDSSAQIPENLQYIKPGSIVFFSLSEQEFEHFVRRTGETSEYDFRLVYKRFKSLAKNTQKALKDFSIKAFYVDYPLFAFITKKGDTLFFDRNEAGMFAGQIFFKGDNMLYIEEGLMEKDSLQNKLTYYFDLQKKITIKNDFVSPVKCKPEKDTLLKSPPDTLATH